MITVKKYVKTQGEKGFHYTDVRVFGVLVYRLVRIV
jgi:hypothetical protein